MTTVSTNNFRNYSRENQSAKAFQGKTTKFAAANQKHEMIEQQEHREQEYPELYSKTLILVFAILFSTIFAAALLIVNLKNLGKIKEAGWVLLFAIAYLITTALVMQTYGLAPTMTIIANVIGAAILNEFFWNKYIGNDTAYKKKSWIKPTLISVAIALVFLLMLMGSM